MMLRRLLLRGRVRLRLRRADMHMGRMHNVMRMQRELWRLRLRRLRVVMMMGDVGVQQLLRMVRMQRRWQRRRRRRRLVLGRGAQALRRQHLRGARWRYRQRWPAFDSSRRNGDGFMGTGGRNQRRRPTFGREMGKRWVAECMCDLGRKCGRFVVAVVVVRAGFSVVSGNCSVSNVGSEILCGDIVQMRKEESGREDKEKNSNTLIFVSMQNKRTTHNKTSMIFKYSACNISI